MKHLFLFLFLISSVVFADPDSPKEDRARFAYEVVRLFESQFLNVLQETGYYLSDYDLGGREGIHYALRLSNLSDNPDMEAIIREILLEDDRNGDHPTIEIERTSKKTIGDAVKALLKHGDEKAPRAEALLTALLDIAMFYEGDYIEIYHGTLSKGHFEDGTFYGNFIAVYDFSSREMVIMTQGVIQ